jgi:hypothetical protein
VEQNGEPFRYMAAREKANDYMFDDLFLELSNKAVDKSLNDHGQVKGNTLSKRLGTHVRDPRIDD